MPAPLSASAPAAALPRSDASARVWSTRRADGAGWGGVRTQHDCRSRTMGPAVVGSRGQPSTGVQSASGPVSWGTRSSLSSAHSWRSASGLGPPCTCQPKACQIAGKHIMLQMITAGKAVPQSMIRYGCMHMLHPVCWLLHAELLCQLPQLSPSQDDCAHMQAIYRSGLPYLLPIPPGHLEVPLVTWLGSLPPVGWQQHAHVLCQVRKAVGGQAPGLCQGLALHPLVQQAQGLRMQELVQHAVVCWQHIQWCGAGCWAPREQSAACSKFANPRKQVHTPTQAALESRVHWGTTVCPCSFRQLSKPVPS